MINVGNRLEVQWKKKDYKIIPNNKDYSVQVAEGYLIIKRTDDEKHYATIPLNMLDTDESINKGKAEVKVQNKKLLVTPNDSYEITIAPKHIYIKKSDDQNLKSAEDQNIFTIPIDMFNHGSGWNDMSLCYSDKGCTSLSFEYEAPTQ